MVVFTLMLVFSIAYITAGLYRFESGGISVVVTVVFLGLIVGLAFRSSLQIRFKRFEAYLKPLICIAVVLIGFFLLELPHNTSLFTMDIGNVAFNLVLAGVLFCIFYFAGQQTKAAVITFLVLCFIFGLANYFVISFKSQPVLPSDLFALGTAAAVSGGYTYTIDTAVVASYLLLALGIMFALYLPVATFSWKRVARNTMVAVVLFGAFGLWFTSLDIEKAYGIKVDAWNPAWSYEQNGSLASFVKRSQDLIPAKPDGYSRSAADELLAPYIDPALAGVANRTDDAVLPSVVVVMNETFSDLSSYPAVFDDYEGPAYYNAIDDAYLKGSAYVSALGGGTCNSEWEFLTGSSIGVLGGGVYPYTLYNQSGIENLPAYFNALEYTTTAIHPAEGENWRRDRVYDQFGFDQFLAIDSFEDADQLRGFVTDRATYDLVLDQLAASDAPQFVFDVTIQNHGGYDTDLIPDELRTTAPIDGTSYPNVDEYISSVNQSDEDLRYLIESLEALDRPVILCFFGDHQPGFADWLSSEAYEKPYDQFEIEELASNYAVPYLIWTNYGAENAGGQVDTMSLNYLAASMLEAAGLPLTPFQHLQSDLRKALPALNHTGFMDEEGMWHRDAERYGEQHSQALEAFKDYAIVQYARLFDKTPGSTFELFTDALRKRNLEQHGVE